MQVSNVDLRSARSASAGDQDHVEYWKVRGNGDCRRGSRRCRSCRSDCHAGSGVLRLGVLRGLQLWLALCEHRLLQLSIRSLPQLRRHLPHPRLGRMRRLRPLRLGAASACRSRCTGYGCGEELPWRACGCGSAARHPCRYDKAAHGPEGMIRPCNRSHPSTASAPTIGNATASSCKNHAMLQATVRAGWVEP
jgi:hypothetical protein